jgi:starch phosphorylase
MKAALNGVLNVSTLDGWWCEGYSETTGWRIGNGEEYSDFEYQDAVESQALYNVLENDVIPLFYNRKNGDAPREWIKMMKASMKMAMRRFSSHKMVENYGKQFYLPATNSFQTLSENSAVEAKRLSDQRHRLQAHWKDIRIRQPRIRTKSPFRVGDTIHATAEVFLGKLTPDEVLIDLFYGTLKTVDSLQESFTQQMAVKEVRENGHYIFACDLACEKPGRYGFTARVTPNGDDWIKFTPGLITWAGEH